MNWMREYIEAFMTAFEVSEEDAKKMKFKESEEWDSMGHMALLSEIEDRFDIEFEPDEMLQMKSFDDGIKLLKNKGIDF